MADLTVREPLRDRIGRAIYECDGHHDCPDWYSLSEERKEPWRRDADRCIAVFQQDALFQQKLKKEPGVK